MARSAVRDSPATHPQGRIRSDATLRKWRPSTRDNSSDEYGAPWKAGTGTEALAAMLHTIDTFAEASTTAGRRRQRRRVFRVSERSYFVRVENWMSSEEAHFTLAELVADTHHDGLPDVVGELSQQP